MKKLIVLKFLFLLGILFILPAFNPTFASVKIFQDNFNSYPEGTEGLKLNWERIDDPQSTPCNAQWEVKNGEIGISINQGSCATNLVPKDEFWNNLGNNYIFDVDMKFITGTDHNIAFRFVPNTWAGNDWYELHFQSPGDFSLDRSPPGTYNTFIAGSYPNGKTYHIRIIVNDKNVKVFIDGLLVRDFTAFTDWFPAGKIALRAGTGSDPNSETWFDNVVVTSIEPSTDLSVPLLKQTDEPWHLQTYDTADLWNPSDPTIHAWGCALTSAAMVLKYHGINKLPDGTDLDPGTLNTWLKNQPDGYVGKGFLNWLSLSRLSKLATAVNGITTFDALEYFRKQGEDKLLLAEDLNNLRPDILEEPGHFIVAKGINGDTFNINDPTYNRLTLNDGYSNTFLSLGRYIPVSSNLSYILLVTDENLEIILKDSNGSPVGEQFIQQPITNYNNPNQTNGPSLKMFYLPKPQSGNYQLILTSSENKTYKLNSYLYDQDGNVNILNIQGIIGPNQPENLTINFDNQNSNNSTSIKTPTFQSTIEDIKEGQRLRLIQSDIAKTLINLLKMAQRDAGKGRKKVALLELKAAETLLNKAYKSSRGILIKEELYQILLYDIQYLKTHL